MKVLDFINSIETMMMMVSAMTDIQPELPSNVRLYSCGQTRVSRAENLASLLSGQSLGPVPDSVTRSLQFSDKLLYIYTSGTTGLPKAAVIKNSRSVQLQLTRRNSLCHEIC